MTPNVWKSSIFYSWRVLRWAGIMPDRKEKKLTFQLFLLFHPTAKFSVWPIGYFEEINRLPSYEAGNMKIYYGVNLIVSLWSHIISDQLRLFYQILSRSRILFIVFISFSSLQKLLYGRSADLKKKSLLRKFEIHGKHLITLKHLQSILSSL